MTIGAPTIVIIPEYKNPLPETVTKGIRLFTVHVRRGYPDVQDPKLNSHSKLNCITACIQASKAGADEALMLDPHGFVATCNSTHFFIVTNNQVWTSSGDYCLGGITRGNIIRLCKQNNIEVREKSFSLTDVYSADEAFVTGTFAGVVPVNEIDGRVIGEGKRGPMVKEIAEAVSGSHPGGSFVKPATDPVRIAMWSGPRNISTAMMRAWENRQDTVVWDEPLYGYYLKVSGSPHPGRDEVIADQGSDWQANVKRCIGPVPKAKKYFFQKHMTLHLLPSMERAWLKNLTNCFLIRQPDEVVASYAVRRPDLKLDDIGFWQQAELFDDLLKLTGEIAPVLDARDVLEHPETMLRKLCKKLNLEFDPAMLVWPAGPRQSDGVWGKYWYDSVWKSTGFAPYRKKQLHLTKQQAAVAAGG